MELKLRVSLPSFIAIIDFLTLTCVLATKDAIHVTNPQVYYVVGGEYTLENEYPFMAALGWINNETEKVDYLGGGTVVAPNFVLTAAHCVFLKGKLPHKIVVGGNHLDTYLNEEHSVKQFFIHPSYNETQAYFDIALIQLKETSRRPQVCLWTEPTLTTRNVTAIGYGLTQFAGMESKTLLKVNLVEFPEEQCKPFFKRQRKFREGIKHSHLCAGDPERKKDTCQGDSGGPLMVNYQGQIYAAGITSTGQACSGFPPAVYTRISSYIDWIEEIVKAHGQSIRKTCNTEEHYGQFKYEE